MLRRETANATSTSQIAADRAVSLSHEVAAFVRSCTSEDFETWLPASQRRSQSGSPARWGREGLWPDGSGHTATDRLRTVERCERRDVGHLRLQVTVDDPGAYENERFASKRK